ncbi:MAG TPA: hypothetical protein VG778_04980 [Blastocatellia bacterium]|jgi:hypothetical protein|nr:hypothetical protein [Blastocatellia bacterium]
MDILNRLIEDLLRRSELEVSGGITIGLRQGGIEIRGEIPATVRDIEKPNNVKTIANLVVPLHAKIEIPDVTFPIPTPK